MPRHRFLSISRIKEQKTEENVHRFTVGMSFEDLGSHIAWCSTCRIARVFILIFDDFGETETCDEYTGTLFLSLEKHIFGFQIAVDDACVMKVSESEQGNPNDQASVPFFEPSFATDPVEQIATKRKLMNEVD